MSDDLSSVVPPARTLVCAGCGAEFVFGSRDQQFYGEMGFSEPRRCRPCRERQRADRRERGADRLPPAEREAARSVEPFVDFDARRRQQAGRRKSLR